MNILLSGNRAGQAALAKTGAAVDDTLGESSRLNFGKQWDPLRPRVNGLKNFSGTSTTESFTAHNLLVGDLKRFIYAIGHDFRMLFDSDVGTCRLLDLAVSRRSQSEWRKFEAMVLPVAGPLCGGPYPDADLRLDRVIGPPAFFHGLFSAACRA